LAFAGSGRSRNWIIAIGVFIGFFLLRGLFYFFKLKALKKHREQYFNYLNREENTFLRSKPIVKNLFEEAGIKNFSVPEYEQVAPSQVLRHSISGFDNLQFARQDVIEIVKIKFEEAFGIFDHKMKQSLNPFFWFLFIIKLPTYIFQFINVPISKGFMNFMQLIYWGVMIFSALYSVGIIKL